MKLAPKAAAQYRSLLVHYAELDRLEAILNLRSALRSAIQEISRSPRKGLPAPRPYPELARHGFLWVKAGAYWFAYHHCVGQPGNSSEITGIFYDRANIPDAV